jgi:hypothetical protein
MNETNQLRKWSKENRGNGRSHRAPYCSQCKHRHHYGTPCSDKWPKAKDSK